MGAFEIAQKKKEARQLLKEKAAKSADAEIEDEDEDDDASVVLEDSEDSTEASSADGYEEEPEGDEEDEAEQPEAPPRKKVKNSDGAVAGSSDATAASNATQIEFNEPAMWVERMALTSTRSLPADLNADDDPKREEAFIQQTLLSVSRGLSLLEAAGVPWRRPDDYYAEMYKSDTHMNDVRQAMEASKARIEAQAHRRAMKDQKKYGKEVQAEVLRQRAKYKRDMQDRISDWKHKKKGNGALRDFLEGDDDEGKSAKRGRHEPRQKNMRPGGGSKKRPGKNARSRR